MNAQDAAESDQTRPADASPKPPQATNDDAAPQAAPAAPLNETSEPDKTTKPQASADDDATTGATPGGSGPAAAEDRDSDAETIVLPGKDGHSPSKARKVRQEDKSDGDGDTSKSKDSNGKSAHETSKTGDSPRKKRLSISGVASAEKERRPRNKDGGSSGLSSAPTSPKDHHRRRRRSDAARSSGSDSDESQHKASARTPSQNKHKSGDRALSQKRKAPKGDSDDDGEARKARRQRTTSTGGDNGRALKDGRKQDSRHRSPSPHHRQHRRSVSNQLASQVPNALNAKRRRLPPPLQSTDYQSDDSSTGGSPAPRSSKLRSVNSNAAIEHVSPAKAMPNKKHLDAHGQTLLARACARGEYEGAKQRLRDRPEDLNVADYAGNTPLQIAAINGCEDIVKLLIDAGCNLDCVNYDKDTPLLDAVDNGHLGVVKLLLDAGVNPRKANVNGEEPIDRVDDDTQYGDDIRAALTAARKRAGDRRRTSEDHHSHTDNAEGRDSHAPESPRQSPAATSAASARRSGTVRSTKTRNDLLYMPLDDKTLRQAAGRGDEETVARILQVKEGYDDPESMVAAARGGHDLVIQLLLGLGGANADPGPVSSLQGEFATPILAAIGQENINVVELLLEQQGFDPTRRYKGETYYEIARRRQGTNWKEEEHLLRDAYDEYKRSHRDTIKTKSPTSRRDRERGKDDKLSRRDDDNNKTRGASTRVDSPREKRRSNSMSTRADDSSQKRTLPKRADSDAAGMSSDGEAAKPRRKLVSKGELRGERDKKRAEPDAADKLSLSEKYHDRARALKRDESKSAGDGSGKRNRGSATPDHASDVDKDSNSESAPTKRRRLDADGQESRQQKRVPSADARQRKPGENATKPKNSDNAVKVKVEHDDVSMPDLEHAEVPAGAEPVEESVRKKEPGAELETPKKSETEEQRKSKRKKKEEEEAAAAAARIAEEEEAKMRQEQKEREAAEVARKAEEEKKQKEKEEAERKLREEEERKRKEQLEREAAEEAKRQREEEERKERERRERAHREEMERKRAAREAELKRIREEQERARLEKLPGLLRWLDVHPSPKTASIAEKFKQMLGVRYDTIRPELTGTSEGREQWILNTHAALLLGEKDLDLSRYTAWERAPVSQLAKVTLWRTEWPRYSLLAESLWDLGRQLPGYYGDDDPSMLDFSAKQLLKTEAWEKFQALDLFFVKLSDLLYTVPNIPHLRNIRLAVEYRELLENDAQLIGWRCTQKWKSDPDAEKYHGFAPRRKYYVNGGLVGEEMPSSHQTSKTPFPEKRVPRRGLVQVLPDDPDYERICIAQGLEHLLRGRQTPPMPNGVYSSSPTMQNTPLPRQSVLNGANGHPKGVITNGVNGSSM